jgi:hypothetical protein
MNMESRHPSEKLVNCTQITNPEPEASILQQKLETTQSEKNLLKKDVEKYLQDTIETLKSVDLAKLNHAKLEMDLKNANDALEKQSQSIALEKKHLLTQNFKLKEQISQLKKRIKKYKTKQKQAKKFFNLVNIKLDDLMKELNESNQRNFQSAKNAVTQLEEVIAQQHAEIIHLKNENEQKKSLTVQLTRSEIGLFSTKKMTAEVSSMRNNLQPSL